MVRNIPQKSLKLSGKCVILEKPTVMVNDEVRNMNEKFFDLKKEKQDRMINAALKAFAVNGYKRASTDDIVKDAGISKGLLFHYFDTKLGLYEFVYDYSVRYLIMEMSAAISQKETDFYALYEAKEMCKIQALKNYPYMQQMINRSMTENDTEAVTVIMEKRDSYRLKISEIMQQADMSRFSENVDTLKLRKIIDFTIEGLMSEYFREQAFDVEMLMAEVREYFVMLKKLTYSAMDK